MVLPQGGSTFVSGGGSTPPTGWLDKPLHGAIPLFGEATQITVVFCVSPNVRKVGKFADSTEHLKAKGVSAFVGSASRLPDQGLCPWTLLRAPLYARAPRDLHAAPCQILNTPLLTV